MEIEAIYSLDADISAQGCDSNPETEHILHHDDDVPIQLSDPMRVNNGSLLVIQKQETEKVA